MSLLDVIDIYIAGVVIHLLLQSSIVRSIFLYPANYGPIFETLTANFMFKLCVFTYTPFILVNSVFIYPLADLYGLASVIHVVYTLFILRLFVIPGVYRFNPAEFDINEIDLRALDENGFYARIRILFTNTDEEDNDLAVVDNSDDEAIVFEDDDTVLQPSTRVFQAGRNHLRRMQNYENYLEWRRFYRYQDDVRRLLSPGLRKRDYSLIRHMVTSYAKRYLKVNFFHVWSSLNAMNNAHRGESVNDEEGGPGFCFALCEKLGVFVLVGWYERVDSPRGIDLLSRFPGEIIISEDECPVFDLTPNKEQLEQLEKKLKPAKAYV